MLDLFMLLGIINYVILLSLVRSKWSAALDCQYFFCNNTITIISQHHSVYNIYPNLYFSLRRVDVCWHRSKRNVLSYRRGNGNTGTWNRNNSSHVPLKQEPYVSFQLKPDNKSLNHPSIKASPGFCLIIS